MKGNFLIGKNRGMELITINKDNFSMKENLEMEKGKDGVELLSMRGSSGKINMMGGVGSVTKVSIIKAISQQAGSMVMGSISKLVGNLRISNSLKRKRRQEIILAVKCMIFQNYSRNTTQNKCIWAIGKRV